MKQYNNASEGATVIVLDQARTATKSLDGGKALAHQLRDAAVALALKGFRIFPLISNGKTPVVKEGQKQASNDPNRVHRFWSEALSDEPIAYNIGIATGAALFVLDIDNKNGKQGSRSLRDLEHVIGQLPQTLTVSTPNTGEHRYFYAREIDYISNGASKLGEGLDIRGDGGYVVGPDSVIDGRAYEVVADLVPAAAFEEWIELIRAPRPAARTTAPAIELDLPEAIAAATKWLQRHAPLAIEGAGGDATTIQVANRVLDYGNSVDQALDSMLEHWNDRCSPPWDADELRRKVENAERYRQTPVGSSSAELEFDDVSDEVSETGKPGSDPGKAAKLNVALAHFPSASPADLSDPRAIPKRNWIVEGLLSSTFLTGVIAPGGTGKTNFALALLLSIVTGRSEISGFPIKERSRAWYWNQEDDKDELRRRLAATAQLHRVAADDLLLDGTPALFLDSGVDQPLVLVSRGPGGKLAPTPAVDAVIQRIRTNQIGVWIIDPLVEFHEADENNNSEMALVWRTVRRVAVEANCAVMVVAHTRKPLGASADGHTGDVNSLRGAGAQAGVMRLAVTLSTMTAKEAAALKVPAGQKGRFVKVEGAKHNLTAKDAAPVWFENVGVVIANGEEVGAMRPAQFGLIAKARPPLGDRAEALLAAFWSALRKKGAFETSLSTEEWEAEAWPIWAEAGSSASKVRENIRKCRNSLGEKGVIKKEKRNQWVAVYPEEPEEPEAES